MFFTIYSEMIAFFLNIFTSIYFFVKAKLNYSGLQCPVILLILFKFADFFALGTFLIVFDVKKKIAVLLNIG